MKCLETCVKLDVSCPNSDCRAWVDYEKEYNCIYKTIEDNGQMTLREVAKRLDISFVRVKQIEDLALKKLSKITRKGTI